MKKNLNYKKHFKSIGQQILDSFSKMGVQTHLAALRDGFALIIPLIIAGAIGVLFRTFVFGAGTPPQSSILGWMAYATKEVGTDQSTGLKVLLEGSNAKAVSDMGNFAAYAVSNATIGMMSVYFSISFGYFLAVAKGSKSPTIAALVGLAGFLTSIMAKRELMDASGIITAILVTIIAVELFCVLERSKALMIKMPDGVPPAVARSFSKLLPAIIILGIIAFLNAPFIIIGHYTGHVPTVNLWDSQLTWTLGDAIAHGIQSPFISFAGSNNGGLGLALLYVTMVGVLWFFGIHGTNVLLGVFYPIYLALYQENAAVTNPTHHIFVQGTFDAFVFLGGAGATLSYLVAIFIFSRREEERMIAKIGIGPGLFQINEPVIFGLPLILNGKYVVPFVLGMPLLTISTYFAYKWFNIESVKVLIPWATPPVLGALLATSMGWKAALLALFNLLLSFVAWIPFVIFHSKRGSKKALIEVVSETQKVQV